MFTCRESIMMISFGNFVFGKTSAQVFWIVGPELTHFPGATRQSGSLIPCSFDHSLKVEPLGVQCSVFRRLHSAARVALSMGGGGGLETLESDIDLRFSRSPLRSEPGPSVTGLWESELPPPPLHWLLWHGRYGAVRLVCTLQRPDSYFHQ